jgi:hypothetical protein
MVTRGQEGYKIEVGHALKRENLSFDFSFSNQIGSAQTQPGLFEEIEIRISSNNICPTSILQKDETAFFLLWLDRVRVQVKHAAVVCCRSFPKRACAKTGVIWAK